VPGFAFEAVLMKKGKRRKGKEEGEKGRGDEKSCAYVSQYYVLSSLVVPTTSAIAEVFLFFSVFFSPRIGKT